MEKFIETFKFNKDSIRYNGYIDQVNPNVLSIEFTSESVPSIDVITSGFVTFNEFNIDYVQGDYSEYITLYRTYDDNSKLFELSNDGSVYTPVVQIPVVNFIAGVGGTISGDTTQSVSKYEDLVIPTLVPDENYEFEKWTPEIPNSGEIKEDITFIANFKYIPTLSELKTQKISEMSIICNKTITDGFDVTLSTGTEHFSLKTEDQLNLFGKQAQISQDVSNFNENKGYEYHQDGELCKYYSLPDMLKIIETAMAYKSYHTTYCNSLFRWVEQMATKEDVNAVYYGIEIPEAYQSEVLKDYITTISEQN